MNVCMNVYRNESNNCWDIWNTVFYPDSQRWMTDPIWQHHLQRNTPSSKNIEKESSCLSGTKISSMFVPPAEKISINQHNMNHWTKTKRYVQRVKGQEPGEFIGSSVNFHLYSLHHIMFIPHVITERCWGKFISHKVIQCSGASICQLIDYLKEI